MPPLFHQATHPVSPELVLIDRDLARLALVDAPAESPPSAAPILEGDARDALLRMCELSDVNPPRVRRGLMLTVAAPTLLWAEAVLVVATLVPLGAL